MALLPQEHQHCRVATLSGRVKGVIDWLTTWWPGTMFSISGGAFLAGRTGFAILLAELKLGEKLAHLGDWHLGSGSTGPSQEQPLLPTGMQGDKKHLEQLEAKPEEPRPCVSPRMGASAVRDDAGHCSWPRRCLSACKLLRDFGGQTLNSCCSAQFLWHMQKWKRRSRGKTGEQWEILANCLPGKQTWYVWSSCSNVVFWWRSWVWCCLSLTMNFSLFQVGMNW